MKPIFALSSVGPLDLEAVDRIGTIQDVHRQAPCGRLLHDIRHRRHVGIEARPDVLEIDDQGVHTLEHGRGRPPRVTVERVNRQLRLLVDFGGDLRVEYAPDSMLRTEQSDERQVFDRVQEVDGCRPVPRTARVIRHKSHAFALERREALRPQRVQAGHDGHVSYRYRRRWPGAEVASGVRGTACRWRQRLECRTGDSGDARTQRRHITLAFRMKAIRKKNNEDPGGRIDPDGGAGKAGMAKRPDRQELAPVPRERGIEVPAECAHVPFVARRRGRRHLGDGERREDTRTPVAAAAEQHPAEDGQIRSRCEQPGVPGDTIHAARRGVVDDPAEHRHVGTLAGPAVGCAPLRGRDARLQRGWRIEHRLGHPERREDVFVREPVERLPADSLDDLAEQEEIDVAVDESRARRGGRNLLHRELDGGVAADPLIGEVHIGPQARHVGQQVANRDVGLAIPLEPGDEGGDAVNQPQFAPLDQQHDAGRRGDGLGQRRKIEDRIERHRFARGQERTIANRLLVDEAVAQADEHDRARKPLLCDVLSHERLDRIELLLIETGCGLGGLREQRRIGVSNAETNQDSRHDRGTRHQLLHSPYCCNLVSARMRVSVAAAKNSSHWRRIRSSFAMCPVSGARPAPTTYTNACRCTRGDSAADGIR